jgi:hypothetical protein
VVPEVQILLVCVCVCVPLKPGKCHLFLPSPCHDPWKRLRMAKSCKGEPRVPDAIIEANQLRESTLTENARSSKAAFPKLFSSGDHFY